MAESPLDQAERHIASLERIIAKQERIVAALKAMGDAKGAALASDLMASFRKTLALAREHRDLLARPQRAVALVVPARIIRETSMPTRRQPHNPVTPADLRERAEAFRRLAEGATDEIIYQELLRLAETYRREADALEQRGGGGA